MGRSTHPLNCFHKANPPKSTIAPTIAISVGTKGRFLEEYRHRARSEENNPDEGPKKFVPNNHGKLLQSASQPLSALAGLTEKLHWGGLLTFRFTRAARRQVLAARGVGCNRRLGCSFDIQ